MEFKNIDKMFSKKYLKFCKWLLPICIIIKALGKTNRIYELMPFTIIVLNALYIVCKVSSYKMNNKRKNIK